MRRHQTIWVLGVAMLVGVCGHSREVSCGAGAINRPGRDQITDTPVIPTLCASSGAGAAGSTATDDLQGKNWLLRDLGSRGGTLSTRAYALNARGVVVGQAMQGRRTFAFLANGGAIHDLGALRGSGAGKALALNDSDRVVGSSGIGSTEHAFLSIDGVLRDLRTLGGSSSVAYGINQPGQIVGASAYRRGGVAQHAFFFQHGKMADLGTLGGSGSGAYAVNDSGQVVGFSMLTGDEGFHAFAYYGRRMRDLGTLGGAESAARDISSSGAIVGWAQTPAGSSHAFLFRNQVMRDLGTLGGATSAACGINAAGWVVGESRTAEGRQHAFLWKEGAIQDLNSVFPGDSGWELQEAWDINDKGQIAGSGLVRGRHHAVLLTPLHAPREHRAGNFAAQPPDNQAGNPRPPA